jgi:hypothetical protein
MQLPENQRPVEGLFSCTDDFINLIEVARDFPFIHEESVSDIEEFRRKLDVIRFEKSSIPILINEADGDIKIIPSDYEKINYEANSKIVYMGKKLNFNTAKKPASTEEKTS